jgi:hypothetical protein
MVAAVESPDATSRDETTGGASPDATAQGILQLSRQCRERGEVCHGSARGDGSADVMFVGLVGGEVALGRGNRARL